MMLLQLALLNLYGVNKIAKGIIVNIKANIPQNDQLENTTLCLITKPHSLILPIVFAATVQKLFCVATNTSNRICVLKPILKSAFRASIHPCKK